MRFGVRSSRALPLAVLLVASSALNASAQAAGRGNSVRPVGSVFTPLPGLAGTYHVRLTSQWQRPDIVAPCPIQGGETVEGAVSWTGSIYEGVLRRTTRYQECAVHGETCVVKLEGAADVHAAGEVEPGDGAWMLALRWTPARDVHVAVGGDCPESYRAGLVRLYRTATQFIVFELPPAHGFSEVALDASPWMVRVE